VIYNLRVSASVNVSACRCFWGGMFGSLCIYKHIITAIMAIPYTGLFIAAICNSRFSHGRYTRSYGTVSSIGLLGQNCKPYMVVHYTFSIHSFSNQTMAVSTS
jgi:hypothetical protein